MALRVPAKTLVDPTGGVEDLLALTLRTPADPEVSFGDDPLRMLRAARFAAQLGFEVASDTVAAMARLRSSLSIVSPERCRASWCDSSPPTTRCAASGCWWRRG